MSFCYATLPDRGVLKVEGKDAQAFLERLCTNSPSPEGAVYAALLSPQGRYLFDFFIVPSPTPQTWFLETESACLEELCRVLSFYKLRSAVSCTVLSEGIVSVVWPPSTQETYPLETNLFADSDLFYADPRLEELGYRFISKDSSKKTLSWEEKGPEDYDYHRIALGVPHRKDLIPNRSFILEYGFNELKAISWTKGCYIGQEVIARTQTQGVVRKRLLPATIVSNDPSFPELGSSLFLGQEEVGVLKSIAKAPQEGEKNMCLVYLRLEALSSVSSDTPLTCGVATIKPFVPPWMKL